MALLQADLVAARPDAEGRYFLLKSKEQIIKEKILHFHLIGLKKRFL